MPTALAFLPEPDLVEMLIEESMPWFMAWCFALTLVLVLYVIVLAATGLKSRSPVEKLLRRRRARRSLGVGGFG